MHQTTTELYTSERTKYCGGVHVPNGGKCWTWSTIDIPSMKNPKFNLCTTYKSQNNRLLIYFFLLVSNFVTTSQEILANFLNSLQYY